MGINFNLSIRDKEKQLFGHAELVASLKEEKTDLNKKLKNLNAELEEAERVLAEMMVERQISNFTMDEVGQFILMQKKYPRIIDKEAFFRWLKEKGDDSIIETTINPQTLKKYIREKGDEWAINNEEDIEDELKGLVDVFVKNAISLRRSAAKRGKK